MPTATEAWTEPYPKHARALGHTKKTAKSSDIFRATSTVVLTDHFSARQLLPASADHLSSSACGLPRLCSIFSYREFLVRVSEKGFVARGL